MKPTHEEAEQEIQQSRSEKLVLDGGIIRLPRQAQLDEETFHVMGSWKEDRYQQSLQKVVDLMNSGDTVPAYVSFQPDNPEDINAIKVDAYINDQCHMWAT